MSHNPLFAASHMQHMASRASNDKAALVMTAISVGLLGMMLIKEFKEMCGSPDHRGHFRDDRWQDRVRGERHRGHERGR